MTVKEDIVLPNNTGRACVVRKDQQIRVIGTSTVDFVAFNLHNLKERFDQARTKSNQEKIFISVGDKLYSRFNNVLFTIVEDTFDEGRHDLQKGMCSRKAIELRYASGRWEAWYKFPAKSLADLPDHGCFENLSQALQAWKIEPEDIPNPFNIFQTMKIDPITGRMEHMRIRPKAGTYIKPFFSLASG